MHLSLSLPEIVVLIKKRFSLPDYIKNVSSEKDDLILEVKTGSFLPSVDIRIQFTSFEHGKAVFQLKAQKLVQFFMSSFPLDHYPWLLLDPPTLTIDVNYLTNEKMPDLQIKDIHYQEGQYMVNALFLEE